MSTVPVPVHPMKGENVLWVHLGGVVLLVTQQTGLRCHRSVKLSLAVIYG